MRDTEPARTARPLFADGEPVGVWAPQGRRRAQGAGWVVLLVGAAGVLLWLAGRGGCR